eukprot:SAG31_NODE_8928_length_1362_cov_1.273159_1_plen_81_part_10
MTGATLVDLLPASPENAGPGGRWETLLGATDVDRRYLSKHIRARVGHVCTDDSSTSYASLLAKIRREASVLIDGWRTSQAA